MDLFSMFPKLIWTSLGVFKKKKLKKIAENKSYTKQICLFC